MEPRPGRPEASVGLGRMVRAVAAKGVSIGACGTCMDARGFVDADLIDGVHRSTMAELGAWTLEADKVIVF